MANNPLIPLMGKGVDIGPVFKNALVNVRGLDSIRQAREQEEREKALQPLRHRLLGAQVTTAEQGVATPQQIGLERQLKRLNSVADASQFMLPKMEAGDFSGVRSDLELRRQSILAAAQQGQDVDTTETDEAIQLLDSNPELLKQRMRQAIQARNAIKSRNPSAFQKGASFLVNTPEGQGIATNVFDPSGGSQRVETTLFGEGVTPVSRMGETAEQQSTRKIAEARGTEEARAGVRLETEPEITQRTTEAQEQAKLKTRLKLGPRVEAAIADAKRSATVKGEALTELDRMNAALPELRASVEQLKNLAPLATHTLVGKGFNALVQELGFGATTGKTARDRFISIMRNQILPMLKPTFGGIVSDSERKALMETMADPDSPPETKIATLNDFLNRKEQQAINKGKEVDSFDIGGKKEGGKLMIDANGNKAMVFPDGSFEEVR